MRDEVAWECQSFCKLVDLFVFLLYSSSESSMRVKDVIKDFRPGGRLSEYNTGEVSKSHTFGFI